MKRRYAKDPVRWLERIDRLVTKTHIHATVAPVIVQREIELIAIAWHGGRVRAARSLLYDALIQAWFTAGARLWRRS